MARRDSSAPTRQATTTKETGHKNTKTEAAATTTTTATATASTVAGPTTQRASSSATRAGETRTALHCTDAARCGSHGMSGRAGSGSVCRRSDADRRAMPPGRVAAKAGRVVALGRHATVSFSGYIPVEVGAAVAVAVGSGGDGRHARAQVRALHDAWRGRPRQSVHPVKPANDRATPGLRHLGSAARPRHARQVAERRRGERRGRGHHGRRRVGIVAEVHECMGGRGHAGRRRRGGSGWTRGRGRRVAGGDAGG